MSGLRGLVKIRKDGEPRLTIRRQEGGGRRRQTAKTATILMVAIAMRASSGVGVNRNERECGDEHDRSGGGGDDGKSVYDGVKLRLGSLEPDESAASDE